MSRRDDRSSRPAQPRKDQTAESGVLPSNYEFDELLLSQGRLAIISALLVPGRMEFVAMKKLLSMTAGNLSVHAAKLESAAYILIEKEFVGKNPRTTYVLTPLGRRALISHVERLSLIIRGG